LPACANREPHGNFPPPFRRAREQQTGKIHACEQNHQRTHGREHSGECENRIRNVGNEQAGFPEPDASANVLRIILRSCAVSVSSAAFACANDTPGFNRPTVKRLFESRLSIHVLPGSIVFAIITGMNISGS
jgi:hypothetical protein